MMFDITIKGMRSVEKYLKDAQRKNERALNKAIRRTGYNLMRDLKTEIQQGAPGGAPFAPLSEIEKKLKRTTKPLRRLAQGVRYVIEDKPFKFKFGWTGSQVSRSWKRIAEKQQEGFTSPVTEKRRRFMRHRGEEMGKRAFRRRVFFLRKSTTRLKTSARDILGPFWRAHKEKAWSEIKRRYLNEKI